MSGYPGTASPPGALYVRALYDYDADDQTSLSFKQGDHIQVITQLESGWWDGVLHGVRGWFPSNYCALIDDLGAESEGDVRTNGLGGAESELEDEYLDQEYSELDEDRMSRERNSDLPIEGGIHRSREEEAAFWIPQGTPDGRLFYVNTLTGARTAQLPLETPTSATETGPRDRTNVQIPQYSRPPPEAMLNPQERDEDTDYDMSASEAEGQPLTGSRTRRRRRSQPSEGVSPATSVESMSITSPLNRSRADIQESSFSALPATMQSTNTVFASYPNGPIGGAMAAYVPRKFCAEDHAMPLSWNRMVEDMHRSIDRYRQAINNSDRSEFVRCAEDISDHLRLLLAAGSGTTDNHSGNPSIISSNRALYPHFREMMSRFSKLVLSSHIASADWPAPDSYSKCLQEAEGVLQGVYGFVEVARQQRGEEIPRLIPGFVSGGMTGGSWQSNALVQPEPVSSSLFLDHDDYDPSVEPSAPLDLRLLERMEELKGMITQSIRRLDEHLVLREALITPERQSLLADQVCRAAGKVVEIYRPWISTTESINLAPLRSKLHQTAVVDWHVHKQAIYDGIAELVIACQAIAAPLSDEWADHRTDPLEQKLDYVRKVAADLEEATTQLLLTAQTLLDLMPVMATGERRENRLTDGGAPYDTASTTTANSNGTYGLHPSATMPLNGPPQRPRILQEQGVSRSYTDGFDPMIPNMRNGNASKVATILGVSQQALMSPQLDDEPWYLKLDHESELSYDMKTNPPQLRAGSLTALVEQLTRHDRPDANFRNTFLLTYRSFTTASELFDMLIQRWSLQPPSDLTQEEYNVWMDKKQKTIRIRVVNVLKAWFDTFWMEQNDATSQDLMLRIQAFAKETVAGTNTPGAGTLISAIESRLRGQDGPSKRAQPAVTSTAAPPPVMPKSRKKLKFLDVEPIEFARQLTIVEANLYSKIKPTEVLNKTWQRKIGPTDRDPAANVKALILHSNQLTNWVAQMILTQTDVKRRVIVIKHFVTVADKCRTLNNFSTLTSIISALGSAPITRLHRTWNQVNQRTAATLESLRNLMASTKNFADYRDALHHASPPCIPFFGVYLTDLTFIEDGIPSIIKKNSLINFHKWTKTAEVVQDIQIFQKTPYPLIPVPELQEYILTNMASASDVNDMYDRSLSVEPREREDEKITRLLSESGFL